MHREYNDISAIRGIFKSFGDAPGGFKEELQEIYYGVGAEYTYNDKFSLRAGYHHEAENKGNRKYFTVGAGFKMSVFQLDAGYVVATARAIRSTRRCAFRSPLIWTASRTCSREDKPQNDEYSSRIRL